MFLRAAAPLMTRMAREGLLRASIEQRQPAPRTAGMRSPCRHASMAADGRAQRRCKCFSTPATACDGRTCVVLMQASARSCRPAFILAQPQPGLPFALDVDAYSLHKVPHALLEAHTGGPNSVRNPKFRHACRHGMASKQRRRASHAGRLSPPPGAATARTGGGARGAPPPRRSARRSGCSRPHRPMAPARRRPAAGCPGCPNRQTPEAGAALAEGLLLGSLLA